MYKKQMRQAIGLILALLLLAACGTPEPTAKPAQTARTNAPMPTDTPQPAPTQTLPTTAPAPTDTPQPVPVGESHSDLPVDSLAFSLPGMDDVIIKHLEYPSADGSLLAVDVYSPPDSAGHGPLPIVLFVMGYPNGAAHLSEPLMEMNQYVSWGRLVAASGLIAITYETERADDLEAVVAWLQKNGSLHDMDPNRIGLWSCSANSPTAMSYAMGEGRDFLKFAVFYYGQMLTPDREFVEGISDMCSRSGCYAAELETVTQLRTDLPLLIVRAGRDPMRYVNESIDRIVAVASDSDVDVTLIDFQEGRHGFDEVMKSHPRSAEIIEETLAFMQTRFQPTSSVAEAEQITEWDYVVLGDSRTGMGQWPRAYADYIETDLGLKVNMHNKASGGQDSDALLADLREDEKLRALVQEAEVVTVWTGGERAYRAYTSKGINCDRLLEAMARDLGDIVGEIVALRGANNTIIHLMEDYHFQVARQKDLGFFEDKKACIEGVNAITHQVAAEYGTLVVPLYEAFNGPDGDQDPESYLEDGTHTNATGDAIIADLLRELGYEPTAP